MVLSGLLSGLVLAPRLCFAWCSDTGANQYWNYHGSGRDNAYSECIDNYYSDKFGDLTPIYSDPYMNYINGVTPPPAPPVNAFIVNIPNNHGGYTPVMIKKAVGGYTGPQGEFYPAFPTVAQLKIMYGN